MLIALTRALARETVHIYADTRALARARLVQTTHLSFLNRYRIISSKIFYPTAVKKINEGRNIGGACHRNPFSLQKPSLDCRSDLQYHDMRHPATARLPDSKKSSWKEKLVEILMKWNLIMKRKQNGPLVQLRIADTLTD
jgi:hypothetical protein